ncbi:MAG: DUF1553 domain-containing protein [Pedosphaera sp.]|nr:DUF1553 domain-containing protein [Pedosphaera sp.]
MLRVRTGIILAFGYLSVAPLFGAVDFARDIQTVFADKCWKCHGAQRSENGLRLDSREEMLRGGDHGPAIVPGKSQESLLLQAVRGTHAEIGHMPKKGDKLTASGVDLLSRWIDEGGVWPEDAGKKKEPNLAGRHWAFQPIARFQPPPHPSGSGIDSWVGSRLAAEGLEFSPEADRPTLIRRLSLDLLGLPPAPDEVDAFLADRSPEAYTRVVERLLASPHYGERWARWWLDAARYADSNGYEKDRTRSIWPWRDGVIQAFNEDLPFDQFTLEQLAGDLLPNPTSAQRIATGFLRNSMLNQEGGVEPEKFRTDSMVDRVDAVGRTWMGLTVVCAQCHNHKYDPISQKEYYQFYSLLNQDDEPKFEVPSAEQRSKRETIQAAVRAFEEKWAARLPDLDSRLGQWERDIAADRGEWIVLDPKEWLSQPMKFEKQEDLSLLGAGDVGSSSVLRVWMDTALTNITGFRLEALNHSNLPFNGPGLDGNGEFQLCELTVEATPRAELMEPNVGTTNFVATTNRIRFTRALADGWAEGGDITNAIDGNTTNGGWHTGFTFGRRNAERRAVFECEKSFGFPGGTRLLVTLFSKPKDSKLSNFQIGRVRLSATTQAGPLQVDPLSERQRAILAVPAGARTAAHRTEQVRAFRESQPELFAGVTAEWDALWSEWPKAEGTTLVMQQRSHPRRTRILKRGEWNRPTVEVSGGTPAILHPMPAGALPNRLGLAQWLIDPKNPLTPRVIVNRVWQQYFGVGLVTTPEDFGVRASPPSHPELLDWLAREFFEPTVDAGGRTPWSMKRLHRLIVTSRTYRQSSRITPKLLERDPDNRLLARAPRFRVDAETIQDIALKAAGLLSPKIGGPSVFPPLPEGVMQLSYGPIPWNISEGDDRYRRALYTFWKRSVPYPMMASFDAPTAEQSCVRRVRSNTPLQALTTLNEPTLNNAARWLGWRALLQGGTEDSQRLNYVFRHVLSRSPEVRETNALMALLAAARSEFELRPKDASQFAYSDPKNPAPLPPNATTAQVAAWASVARAVYNLDESMTKE